MDVITYPSGADTIRAEHYTQAARRSHPSTVILVHGADGITDHLNGPWASTMRDLAAHFTNQGFTVLMPYYFEKTGTDPGPAALQSMFGHLVAWQTAVADAVDFAGTGTRVALVGFSLGGHLSLRLRGSVPAVVEFFAPLLNGLGPASTGHQAHVQIHHGEADRLVDVANAQQIAALLTAESAQVDLHRYPDAGHGFSGTKPGDEKALQLSLSRAVDFVIAHLA